MPDIVPTTPFSDGLVADADVFSGELYEPLNPPGSMEVVNGRLDNANLAAPEILDRRDIRSGTFTTGKSVGATANLDYFYDFYNFAEDRNPPMGLVSPADITLPALVSRHMPISGAGQSFYLYYPSILFLTWHVGIETNNLVAAADVNSLDQSVSLRLFVDGKVADGANNLDNYRKQFDTLQGSSAALRYYSGHCVLTPADYPSFTSEGWHTAGIYIAHQKYQIRTTVRRFSYIALKA